MNSDIVNPILPSAPAQWAVGRRLDPVVDGVERAQRRRGRPMPQHLAAVRRFGGDDGAGLRVLSAVRFGGGRVGMNNARMRPARIGCSPLASAHADRRRRP
jgi:hypothetical protein